jgi:hypothetical protein
MGKATLTICSQEWTRTWWLLNLVMHQSSLSMGDLTNIRGNPSSFPIKRLWNVLKASSPNLHLGSWYNMYNLDLHILITSTKSQMYIFSFRNILLKYELIQGVTRCNRAKYKLHNQQLLHIGSCSFTLNLIFSHL